VIRLVLVDDHPALRAGLQAVLRAEPGLVVLGEASDTEELWPLLKRTRPDVILLDYHLPEEDGLIVCRQIRRTPAAPAVLLYSAYADTALTIPAVLAGAHGVVNKATPANELFDAIRTVAKDQSVMPPIARELLDEATEKVDADDLPILGMLLDGTPPNEAAKVLRLEPEEFARRVDRMIAQLKVEVPAGSP
jgi:DNA-binding NarL/FixJ family response regulator